MALGGVNAGSVFVRLGADVDRRGFEQFEKEHTKALKAKDIETRLGGDFDRSEFNRYADELDKVQKRVAKRDAFKAALGGDYNAQAFRAYERDLNKADRQTKDMIRSQGRLRTAFGSVYGRGGALFAAAGGLYGLQAAGKAVVGTASDINESLTKNQQLFGKYADEIDKFSKRSADSFGISRQAALEYTGVFGNLARALGISRKESAETSIRLTKLAADLASFNNTSIDDALEALRSGLVGETEPLRRFGVTLSANAVAAEAMRSGMVKVKKETYEYRVAALAVEKAQVAQNEAIKKHGKDSLEARTATLALEKANKDLTKTAAGGKVELTAQQKALATTNLIFRQTTNAQGDFAKTSGGAANQTRILKARISDIGAEIGAKLLPVVQDAVTWINKMIDGWKAGTGAGGRLRDTVEDIGDKIKDVAGFIKDHIDLIKAAATVWAAYKTQALLAAAAGKAAALAGALPGRGGKGGAAGAAGAAGAGAAAGGAASKFPKLGGPIGATIVTAGAFSIGKGLLEGPSGPDVGLLNKYADALERVAKAGDAQGMRDLATKLREAATANQDLTKGENLKRFADALDDTADKGGKDLSSIVTAFAKLERSTGGTIENVRKNVLGLAGANTKASRETERAWGRTLPQVERDIKSTFGVMRRTTEGHLTDIRNSVKTNTAIIKQRLKDDPEAGRKALARNFRLAAREIKESMDDGRISTATGTRQIRRLLIRALGELGFTEAEADARLNHGRFSARTGQLGSERSPGQRMPVGEHAGGGWIGMPGMVGTDTVPAMLAPGEAVLNRHQQAVVEGLLGNGFLDMLFSRVSRPHYMAKGGIVPVPGFPGEQAASSVIPMITTIARRFGLVLTDAFGQGHKSPGHTKFGTAADFAGADSAMDRAVRFLVGRGYLVGYDGRFGSQAWPGHGPSSVAGGNAHLHVELGGGGGGVAIPKIIAPKMGGSGALRALSQRGLNILTRGANDKINSAATSMTAPVGGGGGGGVGKGALANLWRRAGGPANLSNVMAAIAMAESGGRSGARNPSGASGLWQILGQIVPGNVFDPMVNARNAVAKWRTQGLGAWEAYTNGSYRQYLARGGRVRDPRGVVRTTTQPMSGSGYSIATPKRLVKARLAEADDLTDTIEGLEATYAIKDRQFSMSTEEFVNEDGSVNQKAIDARVKELTYLRYLRQRILDFTILLRGVLARARKSYRTILRRLRAAIRFTSKKDRQGYQQQIGDYSDAVGEVSDRITELDRTTIPMGRLDVKELTGEISEVAGTQATPSESGSTGDTADADAVAAQATARADAFEQRLQAANQVIAAISSTGDIGVGGSSALSAVGNESSPTGAQFAKAGASIAGATAGGAGGGNVYNFNMPGHPSVLRAIGDAATAGQASQPSITSSVEKLGI